MHPDIDDVFLEHFEMVKHHISSAGEVSDGLRLLIGACFTMEYAIESTALFNPSMVPAIDQAGLPSGSVRFVMSLRATGEGHISSIVFRQGAESTRPAAPAAPRAGSSSANYHPQYRILNRNVHGSPPDFIIRDPSRCERRKARFHKTRSRLQVTCCDTLSRISRNLRRCPACVGWQPTRPTRRRLHTRF